jgi:carbonic anhydrase
MLSLCQERIKWYNIIMKKIITDEQIKEIMALLMNLNIPVQSYANLQNLFDKLPHDTTNTKTTDLPK